MIKEQSWGVEEALNDEIQSLKQREAKLKSDNDVLQRHFEMIKNSD